MLFSLILASFINFVSPVNYEISLAGNFGEPRPNHFHGGIDVKTGGVEGKTIRSIGDGYVTRVTVGLYGYGNAVFIHHPQGYVSVYCHLKAFNPQIAALVRKRQYERQSYRIDETFKPYECPVAAGQLIAVSGNTGASQAPHLHLEIHNARTGNMMDPLDFLGKYVKDALRPMAHGFMVYPQYGEGVFCGGAAKQSFGFASDNLTRKFTAWGKVGFGLWANDYMEITYNRYGIRKTTLTVDGKVVYQSDVNNIPSAYNRMVNCWGDYEHFRRYGVWYMKSFRDPGNLLPIIKVDANNGFVIFDKEKTYHFVYTVTDFAGNKRDYRFSVEGRKQQLPKKREPNLPRLMRWNRANCFQMPSVQLTMPQNLLGDDLELRPRRMRQPNRLSDAFAFYDSSMPLFSWASLSIRCNRKVADPSKLYIAGKAGATRFYGGRYQNGWVTGRIRELGAIYEIAYDDKAPTITPIGQGAWNSTHTLRVGIQDSGSGIRECRGYVDGKFVLFEEVPKSPWMKCDLRSTAIKKSGGIHDFKFVAIDNRGNKKEFVSKIKY